MVPGGAYGKNGSPDIIVCYRGKFIAIEGKIAKGQQSGWQRLRQNQIERAGGIYIVARDVSDVSDIISSLEKEE